jgi:transposase
MRLDYRKLIKESKEELHELERKYRHTHVGQRLQLLGLLKSEECGSVNEAAKLLVYSRRHCLRWLKRYREEGLDGLLLNRMCRRGNRSERMTEEAWQALNEVLERGEIASYKGAREFLEEQGVHYLTSCAYS